MLVCSSSNISNDPLLTTGDHCCSSGGRGGSVCTGQPAQHQNEDGEQRGPQQAHVGPRERDHLLRLVLVQLARAREGRRVEELLVADLLDRLRREQPRMAPVRCELRRAVEAAIDLVLRVR